MIELKSVSKDYQTPTGTLTAIANVDLHIAPGEIFGVIGPSGAGKSSLIRCVNLLERPTEGKVLINGADITQLNAQDLRQARRQMGMIFQHFNLISSRNVFDNIALPLVLQGTANLTIASTVNRLLELTELTSHRDAYPSQLSGGQKQRVAIARALATDPKILLCDEATSALDPSTTHAILKLLKNINEELGVSMMVITHEMQVVKEICHKLAIMEHGKIVEQGDVLPFFAKPKTAMAREFIRQDIQERFPQNIADRFGDTPSDNTIPVLRLSFVGRAAEEPLIAHLMQHLHINLNILLANIESIRDQMIGTMVLEADASNEQLQAGMQYLHDKGVNAEVIGHVQRVN